MARAALRLTVAQAADLSKVSANTISAFETEKTEPHFPTLEALRRGYERAGVEFTDGDQPGVRMRAK